MDIDTDEKVWSPNLRWVCYQLEHKLSMLNQVLKGEVMHEGT